MSEAIAIGARVRFTPNPHRPDHKVEGIIQRWRSDPRGGKAGWFDVKGDDGFERSLRPSQLTVLPEKPSAEALGFIDRADVPVDRMRRSIHRSHRGEGKNFVD